MSDRQQGGRPGPRRAHSTAPTPDRPHGEPSAAGAPLLLLHGTGGDEHDLLPLRDHLSPGAAVLSVRGTVLENGMPRFFRRLREGVFDEDDLRQRADDLAGFVRTASAAYGIAERSLVAVGFSNGANIASALLLRHPGLLSAAVLLSAMIPFADPPVADLSGTVTVISNGDRDPMIPRTMTAELADAVPRARRGGRRAAACRRPPDRPRAAAADRIDHLPPGAAHSLTGG